MSPESWTRFGEADLSNCEREQIHLAGSIQPHGALLVIDPETLEVQGVSANLESVTGSVIDATLGRRLDDVASGSVEAIRSYGDTALRTLPRVIPFRPEGRNGGDGRLVGHAHASPDGRLVVEVESRAPDSLDRDLVSRRVDDLLSHGSLESLFGDTTRLIREVTGYDRVMVYRFDADGHGEIVAEAKKASLDPFLGNHYPASDIPQIARTLYLRNRTRVLVDVDYAPVPLVDGGSMAPEELDMSLCQLRSMSPIHLQYLRNMGVSATLVASLVIDNELWGLIACHHYTSLRPGHAVRAACELVAEVVSTRILALESAAQASVEFAVRRFEQRMVESIGRRGEWIPALMEADGDLLDCVGATGAALLHEGRLHSIGDVPATHDVRAIASWVSGREFEHVFETHRLGKEPSFRHVATEAAGVLASRTSSLPGELLLWFRPEQVRMVTWGGDPNKPVEVDSDDPADLSPRRSFEAWHQLVEGTSTPWTKANVATARAVGASITDVVLQFRSVRLLMAQQQIARAMGQIDGAEAPIFIADGDGACLVANSAFRELVHGDEVEGVDALVRRFGDPSILEGLLSSQGGEPRSWRGRIELTSGEGGARPVLLRADPIFDRREGLLGTVFLFIDLTGKEEMESARLRFQESIVERRARFTARMVETPDEADQRLFNRILDNANLAALEVASCLEVDVVPDVLRSIELSVRRASDLLETIVRDEE